MNPNGNHWASDEKRAAVYLRDGFRCVYCACRVVVGVSKGKRGATLDHVKPRENGGTNHENNLVTACRACNEAKGDREVGAWLRKRCSSQHVAEVLERLATQRAKPLLRPMRKALEQKGRQDDDPTTTNTHRRASRRDARRGRYMRPGRFASRCA